MPKAKFTLDLSPSEYRYKLRSRTIILKNAFFANLELQKKPRKRYDQSKHEPIVQGEVAENCVLMKPSSSSPLPIASSRTSETKDNKPTQIIVRVKKRLTVSENPDKDNNMQPNFVNLKFYRYIHQKFIIPNFLHVDHQQKSIFKNYKSIVQMKIIRSFPSPLNPGTYFDRKYDIITASKEMSAKGSTKDFKLKIRECTAGNTGSLQDYIQIFTQKVFQIKTIQEYMELSVYKIRPKYFDAPSKLPGSMEIKKNIPPFVANNEQAPNVPSRDIALNKKTLKVVYNNNRIDCENPQISFNPDHIKVEINQPAENTSRPLQYFDAPSKLPGSMEIKENIPPFVANNEQTPNVPSRNIVLHKKTLKFVYNNNRIDCENPQISFNPDHIKVDINQPAENTSRPLQYFDAPSKLPGSMEIKENIPPFVANNEQAPNVPSRDIVLHKKTLKFVYNNNRIYCENPQISFNPDNIKVDINQPAGNTSRLVLKSCIKKKGSSMLNIIRRIDMVPNKSSYTVVNQPTIHRVLSVIQTHISSTNVTNLSSEYLTSITTPVPVMEKVVLPKHTTILKTSAPNMEAVLLPIDATALNIDSKLVIYINKNKDDALTESNVAKTLPKFIPLTSKFLKTNQWKQISNQDLDISSKPLLLNTSNTKVLSPVSRQVASKTKSYINKEKIPICDLMPGKRSRLLEKVAPNKKLKFPSIRLNDYNLVDEILHLKNEISSCYGFDDQEVGIDELLAIPESEFLPTNVEMANLFL